MAARAPHPRDVLVPVVLTILMPGTVAFVIAALTLLPLLPLPAVAPSCASVLFHHKRLEPDP